MQVTWQENDGIMEVRATGRLDGYWSDHLAQALDELLRQGNHSVRLNMAEIEYLSSLGIRVLISSHKKFRAVGGSFALRAPGSSVLKVLELAGLAALLLEGATTAAPSPAASVPKARVEFTAAGARFEAYTLTDSRMQARLVGRPLAVPSPGYGEADCERITLGPADLALGLGGFGENFASTVGRFGEFMGLAAHAASQPADGSNVTDVLAADGDYLPQVQLLYGLHCSGQFGRLLRFNVTDESTPLPLSALLAEALNRSQAGAACVAIAAETDSLVGAALRRAPVEAGVDPCAFPDVRNWLSFTVEPAHERRAVLIVGVVTRHQSGWLESLVRPVAATDGLSGHLHAAVFRPHPLPLGNIDLNGVVREWFADSPPESVLHLLGDDRETDSIRESLLLRGACWVAPLEPASGASA
ncbi:MAG: STAS domain-containing protein [Steroidobacteraceae bacterium]